MTEALDPRDTEPEPPKTIGGYEILRRLGGGGMGSVYEAEEPNIGRRVAVKVLRRRFADDPEFTERFRNEARLSASVGHPAIVDAFAFGKLEDGRPYFVMPLLAGESVRDALRARGKMGPGRAWAIARDTASALSAAHAAGLIHRDLKPDNVFLERTAAGERTRVMDFGIAKSVAGTAHPDTPKTQTGVLLGTPAYMAPEQWWGAKMDARVDQYALGAMLFEMLVGAPPFDPYHESGIMRLHLHQAPPSLESVGVAASPEAEAVVARLLAKEPEERFADMAAVIAAGDAAFAGLPEDAVGEGRDALEYASTVAQESDAALASAPTETVHGLQASTAISAHRLWKRWIYVHLVTTVAAPALLLGVGYAGEDRFDPRQWFRIAGFFAFIIFGAWLLGAAVLPALGRSGPERFRALSRGLVLTPAVVGALGTYLNWEMVRKVVLGLDTTKQFRIFNVGTYEAGAARFLGLGLAVGLLLSLVAVQGTGRRSADAPAADPRSRSTLALAGGSVAVGAAALALGAPSGAYVCGVAALLFSVSYLLPVASADGASQIERSAFGVMTLLVASGVAFERVSARSSILWQEQGSRGARIFEVLAAHAELQATTVIVAAVVVAVVGLEVSRLRAVTTARVLRSQAALLAFLAIAVVTDVALTRRHDALRTASRTALEEQFALFAQLDPPSTDALGDAAFDPSEGPALQITPTVVAVNGVEVTRLAAVETPVGRSRIENALFEALARSSAAPLSCLVDRRVPWSAVESLLGIAHAAGATDAELLLTRGPPPTLPRTGPPEATYVESKDFAAVKARLGTAGTALDGKKPFGDLAAALVSEAQGGKVVAVRVAAAPSPPGRDPGH